MCNLPCHSLLGNDGRDTAEGAPNIWRDGCLHADFDGFKGAESYVGNQLRRGTGHQVDRSLVFACTFLTDKVAVEFLEVLVSTVLECTLSLLEDVSVPHQMNLPLEIMSFIDLHCIQRT